MADLGAFEIPDFRRFQGARVLAVVASQMQLVALGWHLYDLTGKAIALGYLGFAQFLPVFAFSLVAGEVADRFDRRLVVRLCLVSYSLLSALLAALTLVFPTSVWPIYVVAFFLGVVRAFFGPASQALLPSLVPERLFSSAVAWGSSLWQLATIVGPAIGGVVLGLAKNASGVYFVAAFTCVVGTLFASRIEGTPTPPAPRRASLSTVFEGVRYVASNPLILGSITLDLLAVLLGGATALLPIYAKTILAVGPSGLGVLRAAPAVGALLVAIYLARHPIRSKAGPKLFASVALFGVATIVFGFSRDFVLSVAMLVLLGGADMVSVIVRGVVMQRATPDAMRGRVGAVSTVFIVASNELGELESGLAAAWLGVVPAVVVGGVGTLLVVAIVAAWFPELRRTEDLTSLHLRN